MTNDFGWQELAGRFRLTVEDRTLAGHTLLVPLAGNVDELLDELIARGPDHEDVKDERIPYFAECWPSSMVLAEHLLSNPALVAGQEVLELGCGLGLAGTAAGLAGGKVLMTDYLGDALAMARLTWGLNLGTEAMVERLDWRQPDPALARKVIIAADVAYEARHFQPLVAAFEQLLLPGGTLWLTEPSRHVAHDFITLLSRNGFDTHTTIHRYEDRGIRYRIQLHRISRTTP